jgi:hypothetical protein
VVLDQRGFGGHINLLRGLAGRERKIDAGSLLYANDDVAHNGGGEAFEVRGEPVSAGREVGQRVVAFGPSDGGCGNAGIDVQGGYGSARDDRAGDITDGSDDGAGDGLCMGGSGGSEKK